MFSEFAKNKRTSMIIHQYECCSRTWWGTNKNNRCNRCKKVVTQLPLDKMIGIGWFQCFCGRVYAGFSRGDVTSKCHGCNTENYPSFIVSGDDPSKKEGSKNTHYCSACQGDRPCPIVEQARSQIQYESPRKRFSNRF